MDLSNADRILVFNKSVGRFQDSFRLPLFPQDSEDPFYCKFGQEYRKNIPTEKEKRKKSVIINNYPTEQIAP